MNRTVRTLGALILGGALLASARPAQADEDFLWGLGIGLGVGVIGTTIAHDHCYGHHHYHGCAHTPVVYRAYEPEVRYVEREVPVYPEGSYVEYKETKVWPFYRKTRVEVIPAAPQETLGRPQAVRMKPSASAQRAVDDAQYDDQAPAETETLREKVEDVKSRGAVDGRTTQVSNRAGRVVTLPAREAAVPARKTVEVENAAPVGDGKALVEI